MHVSAVQCGCHAMWLPFNIAVIQCGAMRLQRELLLVAPLRRTTLLRGAPQSPSQLPAQSHSPAMPLRAMQGRWGTTDMPTHNVRVVFMQCGEHMGIEVTVTPVLCSVPSC